jgi:hypothetical protein
MTWGILNIAMLAGLAGVALPVVIHLLSRRRDPVVDWGAMQFLEIGPWSRRRVNLADLLLMLARMAMLCLVALALSRPFWTPSNASSGTVSGSGDAVRRDVVLILDGSGSMGRRLGESTPRDRAIAWAKTYVSGIKPGDSVALLVAKDRVRPLVDPPSFDRAKLDTALASVPAARGSSDLSAAVGEAFRILEKTGNPARDVIVLTDNQRVAWRPGEPARWALLRDLRARLPIAPRLWALDFSTPQGPAEPAVEASPNGSVATLELSRGMVVPGLPLTVAATVANAGPGPMTRPIELLIDGQPAPGTGQIVGPIPPGGQAPVTFRVTLDEPGGHLLTARLAPADDPMPGDDESSRPVDVAAALPALLVDGEPGLEPLSGETDFLRAALAPTGDDSPQVKAVVVPVKGLTSASLKGQKVVVLANVDRLTSEMVSSLDAFVASGGGLLIAPGDRTEPKFAGDAVWLPANLGATKGDLAKRLAVAHPAPRTFSGPVVGPLGRGDTPALAEADLFAYHVLTPRDKASVVARLDTGDPWIVERPHGRGRVMMIASALDAEAGTLPVNPDFVPLMHELVLHLGAGSSASPSVQPGEPITFDLAGVTVPADSTLPLLTPDGTIVRVAATRSNDSTRVKYNNTTDPGIYRLTRPNPPGGFAYALVASDPREGDPAPLEPAEAAKLAEGWPLAFESDPAKLPSRIASGGGVDRHEVWRGLIFAALGGLCLEVWMTRRMARTRGLA